MGLETSLQEGLTLGLEDEELCQATNILAKLKGSETGKALLLLSHYDSDPHTSFGASDAGSGVATILEGVRAFLSETQEFKNDIIILFTDGEELDLNGAHLFVNEHPWAKDVGLVLNFESRGSGGASYMFMETNGGNGKLIEEFAAANLQYPAANSLAYSVYKMLPNDTDLTIFREDGDIEGFNFAFIDDHFDYHTELDIAERLDQNTLAHQGSYLMPLLKHFSNTSLNDLKRSDDYIYFNIPFFRLVTYPFTWIWPMLGLAIVLFLVLLIAGFRKKALHLPQILKGFVPLLLALIINVVVGLYSWSILKWLYPHYKDILHGFTYNGYTYIAAFVLFSAGTCFWIYHKFRKVDTPNLLVAPIFLWLIICGAIAVYLPGASFFIVPVFPLLASFLVVINQKDPSPYLLTFLALPALLIFSPYIKLFPVALGLKMMVAATALTTLTFMLLLPVFGYYKIKNKLASICALLFIGFMISAHWNSNFSIASPKPTSLLYVLDADSGKAKWATYEKVLSEWTAQYLGSEKETPTTLANNTIPSKYNSGFTYVSEAPVKDIPLSLIEKTKDTIVAGTRFVELCIRPQRLVNRLDIFTGKTSISRATINNIPIPKERLQNRRASQLITHHLSNNAYTELQLAFPKDSVMELIVFESSYDLLENSLFTIPERPQDNIAMPFVINDAILVTKKIRFE